MGGGGGGAWKVAYADFVTAMMAFFMVMWLTAQSSEVKEAVAAHFRNPSGKRLSGSDAKSLSSSNINGNGQRKIAKERGPKKSDGDAKYHQMNNEGNRSNIGRIISFELNATELSEANQQALLELLPEIQGKQYRIEIRGHAASNGGTARQAILDPMTISYRRAMSVYAYLMDQGIDHRRMRATAAGDAEPRFKDNEIDPAQDSRVEVFLLTEMFEEPSSKTERLVAREGLKEEAIKAEKREKAAEEKTSSGGH